MSLGKGWRAFLGSFLLLMISYLFYFVRYPMWQFFTSIEPIFAVLILSYSIILIVALVLIKRDMKESLQKVLQVPWLSHDIDGRRPCRSFPSIVVSNSHCQWQQVRVNLFSRPQRLRELCLLFSTNSICALRFILGFWGFFGRGCLPRICSDKNLEEIWFHRRDLFFITTFLIAAYSHFPNSLDWNLLPKSVHLCFSVRVVCWLSLLEKWREYLERFCVSLFDEYLQYHFAC